MEIKKIDGKSPDDRGPKGTDTLHDSDMRSSVFCEFATIIQGVHQLVFHSRHQSN